MEEKRDRLFQKEQKKRKILRVTKLSVLILCFQVIFSVETYSQSKKVSLNLTNVPANELFERIREQTGYSSILNDGQAKELGLLTVKVVDKPVSEVLNEVLKSTKFRYKFENDIIIVMPVVQQQVKEMKVVGTILDMRNQPLPGVVVRLKETMVATTTDVNGKYIFYFPENKDAVLVISCIGMETQEIAVKGRETIDVIMKENVFELEEVIVSTGYQNIDLRKTTSAIQSIKAADILVTGLQTVDQMLEGHVPGMIFMQNSGQLGATPRLRIRGTSTILGSQEPLWVIDGIVQENPVDVDPEQINDLDFVNLLGNAISGLNPEDIEQIDILKDASATALYGARAANGVIVVTTKRGKAGPPTLSYSFGTTFSRRPHYSDDAINMMNSQERVAYSREMIEKHTTYPTVQGYWMGYEEAIRDYYRGRISFDEMQSKVGLYESVNTDWFDELMQNTFSHKHTVSLSGGGEGTNYYASIGYSDQNGNIRGEENRTYTASLNVSTVYKRFSIRFGLQGNVAKKQYTPSDVEVTKYAYETSRAIPAYNEDGSLWFYKRDIGRGFDYSRDYSILNDVANTSHDMRSSGLSLTANIDYRISEDLRAAFTASYSTNNTTEEIWHGEKSFYAEILRQPKMNSDDRNEMPFGDELNYKNTERYAYTARLQLNFNKALDEDSKHVVTSSVGGEISSNQYYGLAQLFRGYLKERGKKMAAVKVGEWPYFAEWLSENPNALGIWSDKLTNILSGYATLSYTYNDYYTLNANVRMDASNRFGSKANEKLAPIWSISGRWNIKDNILKSVNWVGHLDLRTSFGYQGNMLETESAKLVIERGGMDADFSAYESTIRSFPNPDLKWEKTSSYNATLDFSLLRNLFSGTLSYFYKKTKNAFLTKEVPMENGVSDWTVNQGVIRNQGMELSLRFTPVDTRKNNPNGVRWNINTNIGLIKNQLKSNREKDNTLSEIYDYSDYLSGNAEISGRPLNSFYSYRFEGLNPVNGTPIFYGSNRYEYINNSKVDLLEKYQNTTDKTEIYRDVMVYSGSRVPDMQGGVSTSLSWRRFSLSANITYSFGAKIRLLKMFSDIDSEYGTTAPGITKNVRKEFVNRWQKPGDELKTKIPGIVSSTDFSASMYDKMWWYGTSLKNLTGEMIRFAGSLWDMYDNSDLRTVSGNFVKIQSMSVRYNIPDKICKRLAVKSAYIGFSGTNLHTFCNKRLKGQDPATQDGIAPTINLSLRPTYSFNFSVSF